MLGDLFQGMQPVLPYLIPLILLIVFVSWPMPGRGPGLFARRDVWRRFKFEPRRVVLERCAGPTFRRAPAFGSSRR